MKERLSFFLWEIPLFSNFSYRTLNAHVAGKHNCHRDHMVLGSMPMLPDLAKDIGVFQEVVCNVDAEVSAKLESSDIVHFSSPYSFSYFNKQVN